MEEIGFHAATTAGIDQVADIRIPGRHNAIEWSVNLLKGLQRLKLLDIGFAGLNDRRVRVVVPDSIVHILLGNGMGLQ